MMPLDQLFALEIEYHCKLRCEAPGTHYASALHTSYALQAGYRDQDKPGADLRGRLRVR